MNTELKKRIVRALKKESGIRLTPAEAIRIANALGVSVPEKRTGKSKNRNRKTPDKRDPIDVHIRWMIRRDMPEVLNIESNSFPEPWSEEDFIRCLRQRNCIGMVAEKDERVVGFMIYELHKTTLHVLDFAVHPKHRMSTVGTQLVNKLKVKLSQQRRNRIALVVDERNTEAQLFFASLEFKAVDITRDEEVVFVFNCEREESFQLSKPSTEASWDDIDNNDSDDDSGDFVNQ